MFGSTILEVAIGLLFVYLLLSLLCSAVAEYIEAKFNNRAKYLKEGITLLLNDTAGGGVDLAAQLYAHGLVRPFYRDGTKLPSYIPARTFALALWNIASTAAAEDGSGSAAGGGAAGVTADLKAVRAAVATKLPNQELRTALLTLIDEAQGDIEKARRNIEEWYDGMMDRVSGWYKRRTTMLMLLLGFVVAAVVNADTINIANTLARDGALRSSLVAAAEQRIRTPLSTTTTAGDARRGRRPGDQEPSKCPRRSQRAGAADWVDEGDTKQQRRSPTCPGYVWRLLSQAGGDSRDRLRDFPGCAVLVRCAQQVHGRPLDGEAVREERRATLKGQAVPENGDRNERGAESRATKGVAR